MTGRARRLGVVSALLLAAAASGCAQPGTSAPMPDAARIGVATADISAACGYAEELTAFGGRDPAGLAAQTNAAVSAAHKLGSVYSHDPSDLYQGESVGSIVSDTITLLDECGLTPAEKVLRRALAHRH